MITRRDFIVTSAATASSPLAVQAANERDVRLPLKAQPRVRTLFTKSTGDGRLLLFSDGPESPSKLIKPEALERTFGPGTDLVLQQPDHWRMIEEGWFADEDLYEPTEFEDPAFRIWHANYRPETEAHDLLYDLFRGCCQTNANQSPFAKLATGSPRKKSAPLGKSCGAVELET